MNGWPYKSPSLFVRNQNAYFPTDRTPGSVTDEGVRVDPHVKILDESVVGRAKSRGLDVLVYAPHFTRWPTIRKRAEQFSDDELLVVPARELFTGSWRDRRHVLALGLSDPVPDFLPLEATMDELDRQNAAVLAPHPTFLTVSLSRHQIRRYSDVLDAVEAYNPKHMPWHNRRARRVAEDLSLPAFASSYAHLPGTVGEVWTTFEEEISDVSSLLDAFREGRPRRVFHRDGLRHRLRCLAEFSHLGYENSVKKFDRIARSGMEATHPGHVAYGGRFDDVRVY